MSTYKERRPFGAFDSISISNRNQQTFSSLDKESSDAFDMFIEKTASKINVDEFSKEAAFSNGLQLFSDVKRLIMNKIGVSETVAEELSSKVITKSEAIVNEFGGNPVEVIDGIVEEMKNQTGSNSIALDNAFELHPMTHNTKHIEQQVINRLVQEAGMSYSDAETFQKVIYRVALDLTTMIRPYKREEIALAIVDLFLETKDRTVVYNIKSSPALLNSLQDILSE